MWCLNCGAKLEPGVSYCSECGRRVGTKRNVNVNTYTSEVKNDPNKSKKETSNVNYIIKVIAAIATILFFYYIFSSFSRFNTTIMPNLKNMKYDDVLTLMKNEGFTNVNMIVDGEVDNEESYYVYKQSIRAGKRVGKEELITIWFAKRYKIYLEFHSEYNLLFNKYDIVISLDDQELGRVSNGQIVYFTGEVVGGDRTIKMRKSDDGSISTSVNLKITSDMTFICDLKHNGDSINVRNEKRYEGVPDMEEKEWWWENW